MPCKGAQGSPVSPLGPGDVQLSFFYSPSREYAERDANARDARAKGKPLLMIGYLPGRMQQLPFASDGFVYDHFGQ